MTECVNGRPLDVRHANEPDWRATGSCMICGAGPLHGARASGGICSCSFLRADKRVCRTCAIGIDLLADGATRIKGAPDSALFAQIRDLVERGQRFFVAIEEIVVQESATAGGHVLTPYSSITPRRT